MPTEAEEKRAILQQLKDYRARNGPGCLWAVAKAARSPGEITHDLLLGLVTGESCPPMLIKDWRKIGRALEKLERKGETSC